MFGFGKNPIEKAIDVVGGVANKGMDMWDNADFKPQEKSELFLKLLAATKSQATSISRRHLLWFIMAVTGLTLILAVFYSAMGWTEEFNGLVKIVETWKIAWAFVSAVTFYYLTQFTGAGK